MNYGSVLIVALLLVVFFLIYFYNKFVKHNNRVKEAWSGIEVQLKRRHSLIPNLVESVKTYQKHEDTVLSKLTQLRSSFSSEKNFEEREKLETKFSDGIKSVFVLAEAYPELKSDKNFRELSTQLVEIEDNIQYSRRYYNGSVRDFNTIIESFPGNVLAPMMGFHALKFFEITLATERENQKVDFSDEK